VRLAITIVLSLIGLFVNLTGVVGILRMPDLYTRIQCASKTITLGALPLLAAVVVAKGPLTTYGSRALIVAGLLLLVNPMASHALGRAAYKTGLPMWDGAVADEPKTRRASHPRKERAGR
jgi:multicomponent Na+:H+ antiporter subunit G